MAANTIPSVLINAKIYNEGKELLGAGTVELPDFEMMTESVSGLGIAGELDIPVMGHFKAMSMSIKWNSVCDQAVELLEPRAHLLSIYGSEQMWHAVEGKFSPAPVRVVVSAMPKKSGIGKFEPGKKMEPSTDMEIVYVKMSINGEEKLEIDKVNFICRINGRDALAEVRSQLGM